MKPKRIQIMRLSVALGAMLATLSFQPSALARDWIISDDGCLSPNKRPFNLTEAVIFLDDRVVACIKYQQRQIEDFQEQIHGLERRIEILERETRRR